MSIWVTGAAGFIGSHVSQALLDRGEHVIGIDNLNDYYNPAWKQANIAALNQSQSFEFIHQDIEDLAGLQRIAKQVTPEVIVHLAARAGVRPSIQDPLLYQRTNVQGTLNLLEVAREFGVPQFVSASSSSVYGNQTKIPFSESDPCNTPISPYAATKKAGEMLCYTYAHLYAIQMSCLRFFTVYGPKGRPDMAPYLFTQAILEGRPIKKYGDGTTKRDYTYIDDIVAGILGAVDHPQFYAIYNLGNNSPVTLNEFISTIEAATGKQAIIEQHPMQPGDVEITYADISKAQQELGFRPQTSLASGMEKFVEWFRRERFGH